MADERQHSSIVVDGVEQAPSRAMLYPVGFSEDDFKKPQIGIASTWSMITPCNMQSVVIAVVLHLVAKRRREGNLGLSSGA